MNTDKIKKYTTGNFSKKELTHYVLPIGVIIPLICILLAWVLFPPELNYNIFERTISNLGSRDTSPLGWYFLSISLMIWAITLFISFLYFHKRLNKICKHTARTGTFFGLIGSFFIFMIGIFTDDSSIIIFGEEMSEIHIVIAAIGMGGIALALIFYSLPIQKDHLFKRGHKQFNIPLVLLGYGLVYAAGIGMGIAELIKSGGDYNFPGPGFLSFSFWEWMCMLMFFAFFSLACFFVPEEVQELKEK